MPAATARSAETGAEPSLPASTQGLLVVNLGTPQAPTAAAVRRYLAEFLSDPRVVQVPRLLWWPLLHGVILPLRAPRVARKYAQVWLDDGSPLAVYTARLAAAIGARLPGVPVAHAMRYGEPGIDAALRALRDRGCGRVLVLPLYPQYSTTTTASVADALARIAKDAAELPLRMVDQYSTDAGVVAALADSVRAHWQAHGRGERLLMSFHGIPQRLVDGGDPYSTQCHATATALAAALGLGHGEWLVTFQSRFGREQWLQPATDATLRLLGETGLGRVDVVCPGFPADCLETLEEIALQNAALFRAAGGGTLAYIPCLNDAPAHADALAALVVREFDAWR
ncbi:MAG TPA: ferrochelatase [Luteimonas sp.]|nr:ferrochelatase [Luteimonas sp.]